MEPKYRCIRVAMLNADTSTPNVYANMGTFGDILHRVLAEAAVRLSEDLTIKHSVFDVVNGEYPESLLDFDVVLVTASAASSYDMRPWIQTLEKYIIRVYRDHPDVKIFGSCFGHHVICQALLQDHGLRVEKSPRGWEIGINSVALTEDFRSAYAAITERTSPARDSFQYVGRLPSPDDDDDDFDTCGARIPNGFTALTIPQTVRLQFVHEDQVILPSMSTSLPRPWILLGSTEHCAVQGVYHPGRVFTLQGHFEFDKFERQQTKRIFGADSNKYGDCRISGGDVVGDIDDGFLVAEMVVRFLFEARAVGKDAMGDLDQHQTLPTPRASVEICRGPSSAVS